MLLLGVVLMLGLELAALIPRLNLAWVVQSTLLLSAFALSQLLDRLLEDRFWEDSDGFCWILTDSDGFWPFLRSPPELFLLSFLVEPNSRRNLKPNLSFFGLIADGDEGSLCCW